MKDSLHTALTAAIKVSNIPFNIYDKSFFPGEGYLEGDWTIVSESTDSEYAIVIEKVKLPVTVKTIAGDRTELRDHWNIYYPYYDEGDSSVGLPDAWIIDFDDSEPDFVAKNVTEAALHSINWFMNNEMRIAIDNALEYEYWLAHKDVEPF